MKFQDTRNNPLNEPQNKCKFCNLDHARLWIETDKALVLSESMLIPFKLVFLIPKSHVASIFDLPADELLELWKLARRVRQEIKEIHPNYNTHFIIEDNIAGHQTNSHAHVSLFSWPEGDDAARTAFDLMD